MRNLDLPPFWLIFFVALAWALSRAAPGWVWASDELAAIGRGLLLVGVGLTVFALVSFRRAKTTPIPHRRAAALITTGLYERSRNPIYLADVLMLTGAILWLGIWPALGLVPLFVWVLTKRFIEPEEARLREDFPEEFAKWSQNTGRWL